MDVETLGVEGYHQMLVESPSKNAHSKNTEREQCILFSRAWLKESEVDIIKRVQPSISYRQSLLPQGSVVSVVVIPLLCCDGQRSPASPSHWVSECLVQVNPARWSTCSHGHWSRRPRTVRHEQLGRLMTCICLHVSEATELKMHCLLTLDERDIIVKIRQSRPNVRYALPRATRQDQWSMTLLNCVLGLSAIEPAPISWEIWFDSSFWSACFISKEVSAQTYGHLTTNEAASGSRQFDLQVVALSPVVWTHLQLPISQPREQGPRSRVEDPRPQQEQPRLIFARFKAQANLETTLTHNMSNPSTHAQEIVTYVWILLSEGLHERRDGQKEADGQT